MKGPGWAKTLLVWTYDEHGGYYDHVAPPPAVAPDAVPPRLGPNDAPGGYDLYGFRVPAVVVSPYARRDYVSHVVHDHTSILKLLETKFNLPALTDRDGAADDLLDCVDLGSSPAFAVPPTLPAPLNSSIDTPLCDSPVRSPIQRLGTQAAPALRAEERQDCGRGGRDRVERHVSSSTVGPARRDPGPAPRGRSRRPRPRCPRAPAGARSDRCPANERRSASRVCGKVLSWCG